MNKLFTTLMLLALGVGTASAQSVDSIKFYTEEYPPYNFSEKGQIKGIFIDVFAEMMKNAKSNTTVKDITMTDWSSSYEKVLKGPNIALFSMTQSDERRPLFKWVGPITTTTIAVIAQKGKNLSGLDNMIRDGKITGFKASAILNDIGHQKAKEVGISDDRIFTCTVIADCINDLESGKTDFLVYEENVAGYLLKNAGVGEKYETVATLQRTSLSFAFSKDISDDVIDQMQEAIDNMKANGEIDKIRSKYTK